MLEAFKPSIKRVEGCDGEAVITISLQRVKQLSRVLRGNGGGFYIQVLPFSGHFCNPGELIGDGGMRREMSRTLSEDRKS